MACPDDFSIEYAWQSGSVPPNYFQYTVTIQADGNGSVTLLLDYPQQNPKARLREFVVPREALERLCDAIDASGLLTHPWKGSEISSNSPGESACLTVHQKGQVFYVPHVLSMVDGLRFTPVYEAIRDLAADAIERLHIDDEPGMIE